MEQQPGIDLRLMQRQDKTLYFELRVRSRVNPRLKLLGIQEFESGNQAQKIGILAGAMAEELCEGHQDTLEPSAAARAAMEAYKELMAENPHIRMGYEEPREADKHIHAARVARN